MKDNSTMDNAEMALKYKQLREQLDNIADEFWFIMDDLGIDDSDEYHDSKYLSSLDAIRTIFYDEEKKYRKKVNMTVS